MNDLHATDRFRIDPRTVRDLLGHSPGWKKASVEEDLKTLRKEVCRADEVDTPDWLRSTIALDRVEANKSGSVDFHRSSNSDPMIQ